MKKLYKSGLAVIREGRLLVQREEDQVEYLMPGGTKQRGESHEETLLREVREELGTNVRKNTVRHFGSFEDIAAVVHMEVFLGELENDPRPTGEVLELIWLSKHNNWSKLSPIIRGKILPALIEASLI